jgi:dihydroorotate dehydrogenase (NAD+) catalytic subunit
MVWQVSSAVGVPVVGMGGIRTGEDGVEFLLAGATAIAVGTSNFVDPTASIRVIDGVVEYCRRHGVARVSDLVGALEL